MSDPVIFALAHLLPAAPAGSSAAPVRIKLLDIGLNQGADGRKWTIRDLAHAQQIALASSTGKPLPIDYDHAIDLAAPKGLGNAPASGWMSNPKAEADGIYVDVEWTEAGAARVASKEYRFISPAFTHTKDGDVIAIKRAALTNNPNLDLPALAHQQEIPEVTKEQLAALCKALGLKAEADALAICAAVEGLAAAVTGIKAKLALNAETPTDGVLTALNSVCDRAAAAVDPKTVNAQVAELQAKIGTMSTDMLSLNAQLQAALAGNAGKTAETKVDEAIKDGRLVPAARDAALALASQNPAGFDDYLAKLTKVVTPGSTLPAGSPPGSTGGSLSKDELAICAQLGLTAEQYSATKKTEAA